VTPQLPLIGPNVTRLTTKIVDHHGFRAVNTGDAIDPQDCVTLKQMQAAIAGISIKPVSAFPSNGQYTFTVNGFLAIDSTPCPDILIQGASSISKVSATVKTAPVGSSVVLALFKNAVAYCILTIIAGATLSNTVTNPGAVGVGDLISLQVTAVGSTSPGAYLTIALVVG
jgi:hypothetical protein